MDNKERVDMENKSRPEMNTIHKTTNQEPSLFKKVGKTIIKGSKEQVIDAILFDVLIPGAITTAKNILDTSYNTLVYGEEGRKHIKRKNGRSEYVEYSGVSKGSSRNVDSPRKRFDFTEERFETRTEAEEVLDALGDYLEEYEVVSVAEFLQAIGKKPESADFKYGWTSLSVACVEPHRYGGFYIHMPRPRAI